MKIAELLRVKLNKILFFHYKSRKAFFIIYGERQYCRFIYRWISIFNLWLLFSNKKHGLSEKLLFLYRICCFHGMHTLTHTHTYKVDNNLHTQFENIIRTERYATTWTKTKRNKKQTILKSITAWKKSSVFCMTHGGPGPFLGDVHQTPYISYIDGNHLHVSL